MVILRLSQVEFEFSPLRLQNHALTIDITPHKQL